jgi:integrase
MGNIKKVGDNYFVEFFGNGLLFQKYAGPDKSKAEEMLAAIEESLKKEGTSIFVVKEKDYEAFYNEFLNDAQNIYTRKTFIRFQQALDHFSQFFQKRYPGAKLRYVTPSVIEEYKLYLVRDLKIRPRLVDFTLFLLRFIFDSAIKPGYLNDNPTLHVKFLNKDKEALMNGSEIKSKINALPQSFKVFAQLVLLSGLRLEEIWNLKWTHVNDGVLTIYHTGKAKQGGLSRSVPIASELNNILEKLRKGDSDFVCQRESGMTFDQVRFVLSKNFGSQLKDAFALHLIQNRVSLLQLYKILGLSDIAGIAKYMSAVKPTI